MMEIRNHHCRVVAEPPDRIVALIADFERVWPTDMAPAPLPQVNGLYDAGPMLWQEIELPGTVRAFRVAKPEALRAQHAFEVEPLGIATVVRHTVWGSAVGAGEALWRRIEPLHDLILEALLDNVEAAVEPGGGDRRDPAA